MQWVALLSIIMANIVEGFLLPSTLPGFFQQTAVHKLRAAVASRSVRMSAEPFPEIGGLQSKLVDIRFDRRALLAMPLAGVLANKQAAFADTGHVVVLGATGATGQKCVEALVQRNKKVRAVVRSTTNSKGKILSVPENGADLVEVVIGDVTKREDLEAVLKGAAGVIFAASASKKGGSPQKVDYQGLVDTAQICIKLNVPRLVVVSSGGVSKPDSAVYRLLNLFGEIMFYKFKVTSLRRDPADPAGEQLRAAAAFRILPTLEPGSQPLRLHPNTGPDPSRARARART